MTQGACCANREVGPPELARCVRDFCLLMVVVRAPSSSVQRSYEGSTNEMLKGY
jgi:hypothetical protein